jgi:tRNA (guanine37-N1)-methyltransferase
LTRSSWKDALEPAVRERFRGVYRSYDIVGDILVVKIPYDLQGEREEIGEVLLGMNPGVRLVLQVVGRTSPKLRTRKLARIAGSGPPVTEHREHGTAYFVDLSRVFFSPRLSHERWRVARQVEDGERIVNMFAGVGCYSLLIAKHREASVLSIDSNPDAIACMREGIRRNKLLGEVVPLLGDARDVCADLHSIDRVILPLPEVADEFLGTAISTMDGGGEINHYREAEGPRSVCLRDSAERLSHILESLDPGGFEILRSRVVRSVGPKRWHVAHDLLYNGPDRR